jgi:hypothetical protein
MNNGLGYKLANVPTITGLSTVTADNITTGVTNTSQLLINGVDVSTALNQVPINANNITALQQVTTGITYSDIGGIDLTTIDNNVTITSGKKLKTATIPTLDEDVSNKKYVDDKIAALVDSAPALLDTLNELAAALGDDPNFATTVTTALAGKASLNSTPQTIVTQTLMSNTGNVYYGNGVNLTGISSSLLSTTTMPAGTYYPAWTNSNVGAAGLTPYSEGNISFVQATNRLTVPNLRSFGQIELSHATPIITTVATNTDLIVRTMAASTGSLFFKTQDTNRVSIDSAGISSFLNEIKATGVADGLRQIWNTYYNLMDTTAVAGGTKRGRIYADSSYVYLELNSGYGFMITIGGTNVFQINSSALNCTVPISSTSTVSGATLQSSGNIYLTNSSAFILTSTASANLSVGTHAAGGGLFLNGQGITGTLIVGTGIINYLPTTIETTITANLPSFKIKQSTNTQTINFTPFAPAGTSNPMAALNPSIISCGSLDPNGRFVLTIDSATTVGIRMSTVAMIMGAGGTTQNPSNYLAFDATSVVFSCNTNPPTIIGSYTVPAGSDSSTKIATTAWVQSAITNGNFVTTNTTQTITAQKTFDLLPLCSVVPTTANQLTNKTYVDSAITTGNFVTIDTTQTITAQKTFDLLPLCSVAPSTANQLTNKTYVDSSISNFVTTNTLQTISGQKIFNNVLNTYAGTFTGSGTGLTGVVLTTTNQTIAGNKTFSDNIIMNGGSYTSNIDQFDTQLNIQNTGLKNTTASFFGLVPSQNLSCIVRTDSVADVVGYGKISGVVLTTTSISGQIIFNHPYNSNYFSYGTTAFVAAIQIQSLTIVQSNNTLNIGSFFTTFIGTRYQLGTYVTAVVSEVLGTYSINQNALVATSAKSDTGVSYIGTNRPYTAGGAVAGTIYVDYNTRTAIQTLNTTSVLLDSITSTPKLTTSQVDIYGDCKFNGAMQYNLGGTITNARTLTAPLAQLYLLTTTAAFIVTLPNAINTLAGTMIQFRRITTSVGITTFQQVNAAVVFFAVASLTATASVAFAAASLYTTFICSGSAWIQTTL